MSHLNRFLLVGLGLVLFLTSGWSLLQAQEPGAGLLLQQINSGSMSPDSFSELPDQVKQRIRERMSRQKNRSAGATAIGQRQQAGGQAQNATERVQNDALEVQNATQPDISRLEQRYRSRYDSDLAKDLTQFGYDLFERGRFEPSLLAVPDNSYLLGPGDELRIRLWGSSVDVQYEGAVAPDGTINVPKIGVLPVAGIELGQVESLVRKEAEKYIQGINIDVSLEKLRSLEVYVVGSVRSPGLHLVPAFSTVLRALLAAKGVKKIGSLRKIQVYRKGRLFTEVDLYELMLQGSKQNDITLQDRDVIFVPRIGPTAAVAGAIQESGIFELRSADRNVGDLLDIAGGILPQGFAGRILIRRYTEQNEFVVKDLDTASPPAEWMEVAIKNGDLLELGSFTALRPRMVRLEGHVMLEDTYDYKPELKLSDILTSPDILQPGAMTEFGLLYRYDRASTRYGVQRFPLNQVLNGTFNMKLEPYDRIVILSRKEFDIQEPVRIEGAVWQPGEYAFRPGLKLGDLLALVGGEKFGADLSRIQLSRQVIRGDQVVTKHHRLEATKDQGFRLQPYDYVQVPLRKGATEFKQVQLEGELKYPGTYRIRAGEKLSDVIQRAGGFTDEAYFFGAEFTSESAQAIQQESIDKMVQKLQVQLQRVMSEQVQTATSEQAIQSIEAGQSTASQLINELQQVQAKGRVAITLAPLEGFAGSAYDFELDDGDRLQVPARPNYINVLGSVFSPSSYLYEPGKSVGDYLDKSGGPTASADEDAIYVLQANGEVVSKKSQWLFGSSFSNLDLMPGDTIVVPEDLERIPYLRLVKDVSQILFRIVATAGVVVSL